MLYFIWSKHSILWIQAPLVPVKVTCYTITHFFLYSIPIPVFVIFIKYGFVGMVKANRAVDKVIHAERSIPVGIGYFEGHAEIFFRPITFYRMITIYVCPI